MINFIKKIRSRFFSLNPSLSSFHLEADCMGDGISVLVGGVKSIVSYTETEVLMKSVVGELSVKGSCLSMSVYNNSTVSILGKVEDINIARTKT